MTILNLKELQLKKFDELAERIQRHSHQYLCFESVSDFYKAPWLNDFPQGTTWACTGLDDGAQQFYAVIQYRNRRLTIDCGDQVKVTFDILDE